MNHNCSAVPSTSLWAGCRCRVGVLVHPRKFNILYHEEFMLSDHSPQRVVSLQPSATVVLAAIGKLDRVVACTKYCLDVCPEIARNSRAIVADSWTAKTEEIIAARPDLVIAAVPYQEQAVTEIL